MSIVIPSTDTNFGRDEFVKIQTDTLHPELKKAIKDGLIEISTDGKVQFGEKPKILAFLIEEEGETLGACYVFPNERSEYKTLVKSSEGYKVVKLGEIAEEKLTLRHSRPYTQKLYLLEIGGDVIYPEFRGKGAYSKMFKERMRILKEGINLERITAYDEDGNIIPKDNLVIGLASMGMYVGNELASKFEINRNYTEDELRDLGIDPEEIGVPRAESIASQVMSEKFKMLQCGVTPASLGPIYLLQMNELEI